MPTKTITNNVKISSNRDCKNLADALEKALHTKQKKLVLKDNYEEVKRSQIHKYAAKF